MSLIQLRQSIGFELTKGELSDRERQLLGRVRKTVDGMVNWLEGVGLQLNSEVDFGIPDDGFGTSTRGNIRGQWVTVVVTGGLGGTFTFTHNFGLPLVAVTGRAYNKANCFWTAMRVVYGDLTGTNGAPAAAANPAHTSVHFSLGDAVTANSIDLRIHSNLAAAAATPINVSLLIHPGVA